MLIYSFSFILFLSVALLRFPNEKRFINKCILTLFIMIIPVFIQIGIYFFIYLVIYLSVHRATRRSNNSIHTKAARHRSKDGRSTHSTQQSAVSANMTNELAYIPEFIVHIF